MEVGRGGGGGARALCWAAAASSISRALFLLSAAWSDPVVPGGEGRGGAGLTGVWIWILSMSISSSPDGELGAWLASPP